MYDLCCLPELPGSSSGSVAGSWITLVELVVLVAIVALVR